MNKKLLILLCVMLFVGSFSSVVVAADCKQIALNIKQERNFMKRKTMVEDAFVVCPEDAIIVFKYALTKERYNQPDEALKYYTKAAVLNPEMAKAFFGMGDVYVTLGKDDLAVMAYTKGLSLDPTNVRAIRSKTTLEDGLPRTNPMAEVK